MNIDQQFNELKVELIDKWLTHYQNNKKIIDQLCTANNSWQTITGVELTEQDLKLLNQGDEKYTTKNYAHRRPHSWYILGFVAGLDSRFSGLLKVASTFTNDLNVIVRQLGLNFDPNLENLRRQEAEQRKFLRPSVENEIQIDAYSPLDDIREQIKQQNGGEF